MTDIFNEVSCTYCQKELNNVWIKCCVCQDFDICLQCFSLGNEIGSHRKDHSYKFVDNCATSIFGGRGSWTAKEHSQLLDAVEYYGFGGDWEAISETIGTRTPEEAKEEYISRYIDGNIGKALLANVHKKRPAVIDHVSEDDGPLSPLVTAKLPPLDITPEEARLLGYKPYRDDYEREYNMEAEQLVSKLMLDPDEDTEMEKVLKLAIVDMYTRRLRERARRKRIVRDYQLVAKYFANIRKDPTKTPQLTKEQRDLRDKMRVFSQFLSSGEHERLIASLEREKELRLRLSELLKYRSLGLTTQEEIIHYEQHVNERQQQMKQNKTGSSGCLPRELPFQNGKNGEVDTDFTERKSTWAQSAECDTSNSFSNNNLKLDKPFLDPPTLRYCPMGNLLSENELHLCANLKILPLYYTTLKSLIIQDKLVSPEKYRNISIDSDTTNTSTKDAVVKYLSYSGWLPNQC